ncbi:YfcC family protein [Clostridiaceae bacterium 35-E11]
MEKGKTKKTMKSIKAPNTLVLLCIFIFVVAALTYVLPVGGFDRVEDPNTGRTVVVPDSYHPLDRNPVSLFDIFKSIPTGMEEAGYIIFFLLIIGGAFRILQATGAVESGIGSVVKKMAGKERLVVPVIMFVFSIGGAILGVAEETLAFMPLIVSLCLALGFDSITGTAILLLGAGAGFAGAVLNPFTVGLAQGIAGLPLFSGLEFRVVAYVIITTVTIAYVYRYASKIQKNPELSPMYEEDKKRREQYAKGEFPEFSNKHKLVLLTLALGVAFIAYGVLELGFYITELGAIFLIIGIVSGVVGGLKIGDIADEFVNGAKDLVYACLIVGFARAIMVVMTQGNIMDSIIYSAANGLKGLPPAISAIGMFIVQSFLNVIIPSGSGQAAVSIPIMAPMADVIGVSRQTAVLAYQFGDAFSNVLTPTSGYFMAAIAMSGISWNKWAKWLLPLFMIWCVVASALVATSVLIGYGPF